MPAAAAAELIDWYGEVGRDLPWRRTRDPWAILVSEVMLQQTRVETVRGRYESFMTRFPDVASLAAAPLEAVLAEWSGLGYYRRARSLHALARVIVEEHGGEVPESLQELLALPGLGPYTAAAVASICFGVPALAVDGNVGRVLCRLAGIAADFRRVPVRRRLEAYAAEALEAHPPGDLNQAIMELGARVCVPRSPRCGDCPVSGCCEARALGIEDLIPRSRRQRVDPVTELAAVIERDGRYLLFRGQRPSLVQDMWEFPTLDSRLAGPAPRSGDSSEPPGDHAGDRGAKGGDARPQQRGLRGRKAQEATAERLRDHLEALGWRVELGPRLGQIRHGMTNRLITCHIFEARLVTGAGKRGEGTRGDAVARQHKLPADEVQHRRESSPVPPTTVAAVRELSPALYAGIECGWFTPAEAARLPLAASARKTLADILGETP